MSTPYGVTAIIPAPPGTMLVRDGESSEVVALGLREGMSPMPITRERCEVCDEHTAFYKVEMAGRVNGDSRFGYAIKHISCHWEVGED